MDFSTIDIFCHCIDNFGDAGVAYRFAKELKIARPGCRVRVFTDDLQAMRAVEGGIDPSAVIQEYGSVTCINTLLLDDGLAKTLGTAEVMVETFACHIPEKLMEMAYNGSRLIINLEYLSAEDWVEDYHLKESLLGRGTVRKFYFMPGFREGTGGLIINSKLQFWRDFGGLGFREDESQLVGTVFTYERGFDALLGDLVDFGRDTVLLIFGDKSQRGMSSTLSRAGIDTPLESPYQRQRLPQYQYKNIRLIYMPFIDQHSYDALLCCTDFNIVRGEDSLARAVLSGRPFIWNAYIQDEKYQLVKVRALLKTLQPFFGDAGSFAAWSALMLAFNGAAAESSEQSTPERYDTFFKNLKKNAHAASAIYYFMLRNCNLVSRLLSFLDGYQPNAAVNNNQ
ncbi:MAG: elongation factor P maturation arginine rhamnosyltransferase EarP [Chitinispirillia bacterium]|nr:elongation factor P maturation arginine rhamnosyltransferase EarP [Chitinispirillia bacterium]MCL2269130.1 elongation factor P maturation arginine rhamnosyltransferase EarP [Chitinispirillia bacterium]